MGHSKGALKCIVDDGVISSSDVYRLESKYGADVTGRVSKRRALEFLDEIKSFLLDKGLHADYNEAKEFVESYPGDGKVPFAGVLERAMASGAADLTESAQAHLIEEQAELEPPEARQEREHGKFVQYADLKKAAEMQEKNRSVLSFDVSSTMQPDAPITLLPKDVLCLIFGSGLTLSQIADMARTCRKFYVAARQILSATRPPCLHLDRKFDGLLEPYDGLKNVRMGFTRLVGGRLVTFEDNGKVLFGDRYLKTLDAYGGYPSNLISILEFTESSFDGGIFLLIVHAMATWMQDRCPPRISFFGVKNGEAIHFDVGSFDDHASEAEKFSKTPRSWFVHETKSKERFAFLFRNRSAVMEMRIQADPFEGPDVQCSLKIDAPLNKYVVIYDRAMMSQPQHRASAKNIRGPLVALSGKSGWLSTVNEYHPETRTWTSKQCSG